MKGLEVPRMTPKHRKYNDMIVVSIGFEWIGGAKYASKALQIL